MSDEEIRAAERIYIESGTTESLGNLLNLYRRHGILINLVETKPEISKNDIAIFKPEVRMKHIPSDPIFGPWGLENFRDSQKIRTVLPEVFGDAGLPYDPDRLGSEGGRLTYSTNSFEEAKDIVNRLNSLGMPKKAIYGMWFIHYNETLEYFMDSNNIPVENSGWNYFSGVEERMVPEDATPDSLFNHITFGLEIPKVLTWDIEEQKKLLQNSESPGLLHITGPIPEFVQERITSQQEMVTQLFQHGAFTQADVVTIRLDSWGYIPETFLGKPIDDREIVVAMWEGGTPTRDQTIVGVGEFMASIHIKDASTEHLMDEIIDGVQSRVGSYTRELVMEELITTLNRNGIWDEIVWVPEEHWV